MGGGWGREVLWCPYSQVDDTRQTDHWENFQSMNWNSCRLKPPPPTNGGHDPTSKIGWRVELRTMESQLTDFENAATAVVSQLLVKVLLRDRLDLYTPISRLEENIARANMRNAVVDQKFWFRGDVGCTTARATNRERIAAVREFSLHDILFGADIGLLTRCQGLVEYEHAAGRCSTQSRALMRDFILLFKKRCVGDLPTDATFLRRFVAKHPDYRRDSVLTRGSLPRDLLQLAQALGGRGGDMERLSQGLLDRQFLEW